ncbi:hypothetical protein CAEBREN_12855 [Caenorhabditis brenneri]|uniref:Uncharacterized protein n=1 Tax=Caenorhabditis brenneri TaxID=135651 RepID=G0PJG7_CAEBE|nr:hypothetical protein CAEBREN_12855 [Caenorhabditis brenneri]
MDNNANPGRAPRKWVKATDEEKARGNEIKEEKRRVEEQKKMQRDQFLSRWPEIKVNYEPNVWWEAYERLHAEALTESKTKLQQLEELSQEEAERKVSDILLKATFVELNLAKNGQQSAETLFNNLELATENKEEMPFKTVEDLTEFLKSMVPTFKMDIRTRKWKNTGVQTRKFCQVLRERLSLGDQINDGNFDETYEEFRKTIKAPNPMAQVFAEKEVFCDISSYRYLAAIVPAFKYDKRTGRLSLNGEVRLLALHLPILAATLHSNNPKWSDQSRVVTSSAIQYGYGYPNVGRCLSVDPRTDGVRMSVYRPNMENVKADAHGHLLNVTHIPFPNTNAQQLEAIRAEPTRLDYAHNFVTGTGPVMVGPDGKKRQVDFGTLTHYLKDCKEKTAYRKE